MFRSKASLKAFLLKNTEDNLDIDLFDFTASRYDVILTSKRVPAAVKKKDRNEERETTETQERPPNTCRKAAAPHRRTRSKQTNSSCTDAWRSEVTDETEEQSDAAAVKDHEEVQSSPRRLREKILRLTSSVGLNVPVEEDDDGDPRPSAPTVSVQPATESEDEGEAGLKRTDNKSTSEEEPGADRAQGVTLEVSLPDTPVTPTRTSQNSTCFLHCLTHTHTHRCFMSFCLSSTVVSSVFWSLLVSHSQNNPDYNLITS